MKHLKTFEGFSYESEQTNEGFLSDLMKGAVTINLNDKPSEGSEVWLKKSPWNKEVDKYAGELKLTADQVKNFFRLYFDKSNKGIKKEDVEKNKFQQPRDISKLDITVDGSKITVKDKKISTSNPGAASR